MRAVARQRAQRRWLARGAGVAATGAGSSASISRANWVSAETHGRSTVARGAPPPLAASPIGRRPGTSRAASWSRSRGHPGDLARESVHCHCTSRSWHPNRRQCGGCRPIQPIRGTLDPRAKRGAASVLGQRGVDCLPAKLPVALPTASDRLVLVLGKLANNALSALLSSLGGTIFAWPIG